MNPTCFSNPNNNEPVYINMWVLPLCGMAIKIKIIFT